MSMKTEINLRMLASIGFLSILAACTDPEVAAEKSIGKAADAWESAKQHSDPGKRLKAYEGVARDLRKAAEKYGETAFGRQLLNGGSAAGVSLKAIEEERERLAERVDCYANPTAECLAAFVSAEGKQLFGTERAVNGPPPVQASRLICSGGVDAAVEALQPMKVNRGAYIDALLQAAMAAADCDKPDAAAGAIDLALTETPGGEEAAQLAGSIIATSNLSDGHEAAYRKVESLVEGDGLQDARKAGLLMTLIEKEAAEGEVKSALARYRLVTDEMNFAPTDSAKKALYVGLALDGKIEEATTIAGSEWQVLFASIPALAETISAVGNPQSGGQFTLAKYDAPIADGSRTIAHAAAARFANIILSGELDQRLGSGLAGQLAVVQQRLGNQKAADELLDYARPLHEKEWRAFRRQRGQTGGAYSGFVSPYAEVIAYLRGDYEKALKIVVASHGKSNVTTVDNWLDAIIEKKADDAPPSELLDLANRKSTRQNYQKYRSVIDSLIEAGRIADAEQALSALPENQDSFARPLAEKAIEKGNFDAADRIMSTYGLDDPSSSYRFNLLQAKVKKMADGGASRRDLEAVIDAMLETADAVQAGRASQFRGLGRDNDLTEFAISTAFEIGLVDKAIALAAKTPKTTRQTYFGALDTPHVNKKDLPKIILAAHDDLPPDELEAVITVLARHLADKA